MATNLFKHHKILLEDSIRMEAYKKAISEVVTPGDIVADLGSGLGILSFLALKAGAKKVYAIEAEPETLQTAKIIAEGNGLGKDIKFIKGISCRVKLSEKVDVVISETLGNLGFNENILPAIIDARKRFLKPKGKIIPQSIGLFIAPVEHRPWIQAVDSLKNMEDINFLPDDSGVSLGISSEDIGRDSMISNPAIIFRVELTKEKSPLLKNTVEFEVKRDAILSGFAGWFRTRLFGDICISTAPDAGSTHWKQAFLPLRRPLKVKEGAKIGFYLKIEPDGVPFGPESIISYNFEIEGGNLTK